MHTSPNTGKTPCRIYLGTSGYSFPEWIEAGFYPHGTSGKDMLSFYASQFNAIELNYTWYQMPKADAMERMLSRVPAGFVLNAQLTRTMTHEIDPKNWQAQVRLYRLGIAPLVQADRLRAVLVQLGPAFERTRENRLHLARLLDQLQTLPAAVEFRHRSWADDRVFAELEKRRVALVAVDVPDLPHLFPTQAIVTSPELFYVRFHGRNISGWHSGNMQKQFDFDYSLEELQPWSETLIPQIAGKARSGAIFFNNHVRGQAPQNARMMIEQLAGRGYEIKV
jgi:uncharacterized protein YecE (DUF72 family)